MQDLTNEQLFNFYCWESLVILLAKLPEHCWILAHKNKSGEFWRSYLPHVSQPTHRLEMAIW